MCTREKAGALFGAIVTTNRTTGGLGETICVPGNGTLHHVILSDRQRAWCFTQTGIGDVPCSIAMTEVCEHIRMAAIFLDNSAQFCYSRMLADSLARGCAGSVHVLQGMQSKQTIYIVSKAVWRSSNG